MTTSFNAEEHHITLCLRDEQDRLVTQINLLSKVRNREALKYGCLRFLVLARSDGESCLGLSRPQRLKL